MRGRGEAPGGGRRHRAAMHCAVKCPNEWPLSFCGRERQVEVVVFWEYASQWSNPIFQHLAAPKRPYIGARAMSAARGAEALPLVRLLEHDARKPSGIAMLLLVRGPTSSPISCPHHFGSPPYLRNPPSSSDLPRGSSPSNSDPPPLHRPRVLCSRVRARH